MSQHLTNIGKVETAGAASIGNVSIINSAGWIVNVSNTGGSYSLLNGTGLIGTMNTLAIGGGSTVSVVNSAGWLVSVVNTATTINIANTGGAYSLLSGTGIIGTANTISIGSTLSIIGNSAGWTVNVSNTGGAYTLSNGTGLVGTANTISIGSTLVIIGNSAGWVVNTANHLVDATIEAMSMTSSGINVYPYSISIECSETNNLIIAASASRVFKVLGYTIMAGVANKARFQSGSNSTTFTTGTMFFGASGGMVAPYNPMGWFSVTAGSPLYLTLASANSVGGVISYLVM